MNDGTRETRSAVPTRRRGRWSCLLVCLFTCLLVCGAGWYGWHWYTRPVPPAIQLTEEDPELAEDLQVLDATDPLGAEDYAALAEHGERVRRNAGRFQ